MEAPRDQLFVSAPIDRADIIAQVSTYMGAHSLHLFAWGFLEVAEISVERCVQNQCSVDAVVPAALYCVRHSVELFLKFLVYDRKLVGDSVPIVGHNVSQILEIHRERLFLAFDYEPAGSFRHREWMARLERVVASVHRVDPDGQTLRYPHDTAMTPNSGYSYSVNVQSLSSEIAAIRLLYQEYDERDA